MAKKAKKTAKTDKKTTGKGKADKKKPKSKAKPKSKKSTKSKKSKAKSKKKATPKKSAAKTPKKSAPAAAKQTKKAKKSGKVDTHEKVYSMRNYPQRKFQIKATFSKGKGDTVAAVSADIREGEGDPFRYIVEFAGEFTSTKSDFTDEMYLLTAVSVMESQIESHKHVGTLLRIHRDSGLIHTEFLKQAAS